MTRAHSSPSIDEVTAAAQEEKNIERGMRYARLARVHEALRNNGRSLCDTDDLMAAEILGDMRHYCDQMGINFLQVMKRAEAEFSGDMERVAAGS